MTYQIPQTDVQYIYIINEYFQNIFAGVMTAEALQGVQIKDAQGTHGLMVDAKSAFDMADQTLESKMLEMEIARYDSNVEVIYCRPSWISTDGDMISAYVGVVIMFVMAVYARWVELMCVWM